MSKTASLVIDFRFCFIRVTLIFLYYCIMRVISIIVCWFFMCLDTSRNLAIGGLPFSRLRPLPTDQLPIPVLEEDPNREYDPSESDIDNRVLKTMLGLDYLPNVMSFSYPRDFDDSEMVEPLSSRISPEIRKLFKRSRKSRKPPKRIMKNKRIIQSWLSQETACPVRYRWKDLGIRFWPRWIKEGFCDSSKSCSIPPGMKCKSSAQTKMIILRWYCQGILEQKYCTWIRVHYPVISECNCQC